MAQTILTKNGYERPTLPELLQQIGDQLSNVVGPVNRNADSGIGQIIGVFAEALGVSHEVAEEIFNSRFIRSASGLALDSFGDWLGLPRRGRTNTTVPVILYGVNGSPVPAGSVASYANHNFTLDAAVTISLSNTTDATFRVGQVVAGDVVGLRINGANYQHNVPANGNASTAAAAIAALVDTAGSTGNTPFDAVSTGSDVRVTSNNLNSGVSITPIGKVTNTVLGTPGRMTATEIGAIVVPKNTLNSPVTAVAGWTGITNPTDGSTGSDRESDTDYRARLAKSDGTLNGLSTPAAIRRVVAAVPGVTAVSLIVNNKMTVGVENQPPKSYRVVVAGGDGLDIANAIYTAGGAGIETFGQLSANISDEDGEPHTIFFDRMTVVEYDVEVKVTTLNDEETLTPSAQQVIEQAVREYFAGLGLGDDIVPQRMIVPIYQATEGIAKVDIVVKNTAGVVQTGDLIEVPASSTGAVRNVQVTI